MSSNQGEGCVAELPGTSRQPAPARYHSNGYTSRITIPSGHPAASNGHASGAYTPSSHAVSNDWNMANEMEQQAFPLRPRASSSHFLQGHAEMRQPQSPPRVNIEQQHPASVRIHAAVADAARQTQQFYAPFPPAPRRGSVIAPDSTTAATVPPISVPEGAVGVVKEVILEPQPANTKRRVSFITNTQPLVTTIQAKAAQRSASTIEPHTVILNQLKAVRSQYQSRSDDVHERVSRDFALQNGTSTLSGPSISRKPSIRRSFRSAAQGLLAALRIGEPPVGFKADDAFAEWKTYLAEFNHKYDNMEDGYEPFQDVIEEAFDAKYKDLMGEGKFFLNEEERAELPAEVPVELPVQEAEVVPTEDADTWLAHRKAEEAFSKVRDAYTGSARRRLSASELVVHPPSLEHILLVPTF